MSIIMDKTLLTINSIKNLESIKIYDLPSFKLDDTRKYVLPAMMISYDGGKYLNMYSREKYFNEFVLKVQEVYLKERESSKVDKKYSPFIDKTIDIDPASERILLEGNLDRKDDIYAFYSNKKNYDYSLFYEKDDMKLILPIIKYHFKDFLNNFGMTINYKEEDNFFGYRQYYAMDVLVDGLEDKLLFSFDRKDNSYSINIRSMSRKIPNSVISVSINTDEINVESKVPFKDIVENVRYEFINNASIEKTIHKNGELLSYDKKPIRKRDKLSLRMPVIDDFDGYWYFLPWNGYFGIKEEITPVNELEKITTRDSKFVIINDDSLMIHDDYRKKWVSDKGLNVVQNSMVLDRIKKTIKGKKLVDDTYILETHILDDTVPYNDKYFYHVTQCKSIDDIDKSSLVSLSKDDNVIYSGDLYDEQIIGKKLGKRLNNGIN